jgi:hypothetical protein
MSNNPKSTEFPGKPTLISGVVHPHGAGGSQIPGQNWRFRFALETWRGEDGVLHSEKLTVTRQVSHEALRELMRRVKPYDILTARVVFTAPAATELLELLDQPAQPDEALVRRAAELQQSRTFVHARFGTFTFDRRVDWYTATVSWAGQTCALCLSAVEDAEIDAALSVATTLWDDEQNWNQRVQDYAVQELLDLKNDTWLEPDEAKLSPDDFKARMRLESIVVNPGGELEFWHDDGDLFWGHSIWISGSLSDGLTRADIPG